MKNWKKLMLGLAVAVVAAPLAWAAGLIGDLPLVGGAAYCASTSTGPNGPTCAQTVPAGPAVFAGTEYTNFDVGPLGGTNGGAAPQTVGVNIQQLGQGAIVDLTSVAATQVIPANTAYYFIDGAQAAAFTVTMPASPIEGTIVNVTCEQATAGTLTVAANTGQNIKFNPNAACVAGTNYRYRWVAAQATWFKA